MAKDKNKAKPEQIDEKELDKASGGFSWGVSNTATGNTAVAAPTDVATGQATGKRQHLP